MWLVSLKCKMMFVITPCNTHAQRSCAIRIDPVGGSYTSKPSAAGKGGRIHIYFVISSVRRRVVT